MSQQKTPSTRTKVTSMIMGSRVVSTTSKRSSLARTIPYISSNAPRPHLFSYSDLNHRAECYNEKLPTPLQKSRDSTSIAAHQEITRQAHVLEFVQQDRPLGSVSVPNRHHVYPKTNTNRPDYQPFLSFHPYSYFNIDSHFSPDDRANTLSMQEYSGPPGYDTSGYHHPRGSTYYCNTYRLDEVHQVPPRSHQSQSEPKACASSRKNDSSDKVDHTYRDFSGVPPSTEDLKRYEHKIEECTRRKKNKGKGEPASNNNSSSIVPPSHRQRKADALATRRGRGNRASQDGENAFVGFMGTNFPARLHDLLSHEDDVGDIISWLPHGRSWVVRDKAAFLEKVAPTHFQITKFESFTRQVNGWGFKRITQGPDINSYYHELFLRGMPHLIQWMKRVSSTAGAGKRRLRADPSEEPNFYDISEKYPIPDYYNRNGGRPLSLPTSMKSSFNKMLGGDDDNKDGKKQLSTRPLDNSCKTEETSKKKTTVSSSKQPLQEDPPSQELGASEFNCCNSRASSMVIASSKKEQCDPTDFEDHMLYDHRAFYQMPMLSPACLSSPPKIIDNLANLGNSHSSSLKDVTSEEFWTRSDAASHLDPRPVFRTTVHGEEESDLYDVMIAPAVSKEESSESCTNCLLPTNNQWQSICDLLLEDEDLDQESSDIHTSKGSWKKATTV